MKIHEPTIQHDFVVAMLIKNGDSGNHWALKGSNAQSGGLQAYFDGPRPQQGGYSPMKKKGAIIMGIGGDNSDGAVGAFYVQGLFDKGFLDKRDGRRIAGEHCRCRVLTAARELRPDQAIITTTPAPISAAWGDCLSAES